MNTPATDNILTFKVNAYRIQSLNLKQDPLKMIRTLQDIMRFPCVNCILKTTKGPKDISSGNYAFVILVDNHGNEKPHVIHLLKSEGVNFKCIAYDPLTAWDSDATLTKQNCEITPK